jgi:Cu-Zn family superoxide dismutase
MKMNQRIRCISLGLLALALGFCIFINEKLFAQDAAQHQHEMMMGPTKAIAVLHSTMGNNAKGLVTFTKEEDGVRVIAVFEGVPAGVHGFHIHEFGDCSSADGTAAGGHFNPQNMEHAGPMAEKRHVGDLGNITADESGKAQLNYVDKHLAFSGPNSILGRGLILHAKADDLKTQPTGDAGGRIACGVIGVAKQ